MSKKKPTRITEILLISIFDIDEQSKGNKPHSFKHSIDHIKGNQVLQEMQFFFYCQGSLDMSSILHRWNNILSLIF
jgi:hypothetical protein